MGMKLYGTCVLVVRGVAYVFRHPERSRSASSPVGPASQTQARTGFTGALKTQRRIVHPNDAQNSAGSNYISPIARMSRTGNTIGGNRTPRPRSSAKRGPEGGRRPLQGSQRSHHRDHTTEITPQRAQRPPRADRGEVKREEVSPPLLNLCVLCGESCSALPSPF